MASPIVVRPEIDEYNELEIAITTPPALYFSKENEFYFIF
jgi:hypothetical protein